MVKEDFKLYISVEELIENIHEIFLKFQTEDDNRDSE